MDLGAVFFAAASKPLIVSDIDNVLAFEAEAACLALNARFGTNRTVSTLTAYPFRPLLHPDEALWLGEFSGRDQWAVNLCPDRDALRALATIRATGHSVVISSDRPASLADATFAWLAANGAGQYGTRLGGPGSKQAALAGCGPDSPGVLVDDDPRYWLTAARAGVQVWSPRRPWTPQAWQHYPNVRVFTNWSEPLSWLGTPPPAGTPR